MLHRGYVGPPGRQVHLICADGAPGGPPLVCLHATAYSAESFTPVLQALAGRRRAFALDTPGYGGSDRPAERPDAQAYAAQMIAALDELGEPDVDILGYHTGAVFGAEMARQRPDLVRRLVLVGIPFFEGDERQTWKARLSHPSQLTDRLDQFAARWRYLVTDRPPGMSLPRGFANFVDELRAYPAEWWAHEAAFDFDLRACLERVSQPVLVLNPQNHLSEASRRAAAVLPAGHVVELPHLKDGVLEVAAQELADKADAFLRAP